MRSQSPGLTMPTFSSGSCPCRRAAPARKAPSRSIRALGSPLSPISPGPKAKAKLASSRPCESGSNKRPTLAPRWRGLRYPRDSDGAQRELLPHRGYCEDGRGRNIRCRSPAPRPRGRGIASSRYLDHADAGFGQLERPGHDDWPARGGFHSSCSLSRCPSGSARLSVAVAALS